MGALGTWVERRLSFAADVRPGEGRIALPLTLNVAILMIAYYILKTTREVLILGAPGGAAEIKSYAAALQAVLLIGVSIGFGWLAGRFRRLRLFVLVYCFFILNLLLFALLLALFPSAMLLLAILFFVWLGCFNVTVMAQFWAYANDLYRREDGERLFPLVASGGALGAVLGAELSGPLLRHLPPEWALSIGAALLVLALLLTLHVERRALGARSSPPPVRGSDGFALLIGDPYLTLVAALALVKNWVNTLGEYVLDRRLLELLHGRLAGAALRAYIAGFKSTFLTSVNVLTLLLQLFVVSRLMRKSGVGGVLLLLPIVSLLGYGAAAFAPSLAVLFLAKLGENSVDYSLEKTGEQALYLVTDRAAKYRAKATIDTFVVRLGDVLSALVVFVGQGLHAGTREFLMVNIGLGATWLALVLTLARVHRQKTSPSRELGAPQLA